MDKSRIDQPQTVTISWQDQETSDKITDLTFTYKPDPEIFDIYPNVTILE